MEKRRCSNCGYLGKLGVDPCCDYILINKRRRPCPGGDGCEAWEPVEQVQKRIQLLREEMDRIVPTLNAAMKTVEFRQKRRETLTEEQRRERKRERERLFREQRKNDPEYRKKQSERGRKYRAAHKDDPAYRERKRQRQREFRERHLEEIRAKDRERRRKKPENQTEGG